MLMNTKIFTGCFFRGRGGGGGGGWGVGFGFAFDGGRLVGLDYGS